MFENVKKVAGQAAVAVGGVAMTGLAMAQSGGGDGVDVTGVTAALTSAQTGIGTIAAGMLLCAGAGIAVKWVLGFLFG